FVAAGGPGASLCADRADGQPGQAGGVLSGGTPRSRAVAFDQLQQPAEGLAVRFSAAAAENSQGDDVVIAVCGLRVDSFIGGDFDGDGFPDNVEVDIPSEASQKPHTPCGRVGNIFTGEPVPVLGRLDAQGTLLPFDPANPDARTIPLAGALDDGVWFVWTVAMKPNTSLGCSLAFHDCLIEPNPDVADIFFDVDGTPPSVTVTANPEVVGVLRALDLRITATDGSDGSGIGGLVGCTETALDPDGVPGQEAELPCLFGENRLVLRTAGDGTKRLRVEVVDGAGNVGVGSVDVVVDTREPGFAVTRSPAEPDNRNGWYRQSPVFELSGFFDEGSGADFEGPHWAFRFDDGPERRCADVECEIVDDLPGRGRHALHFTAIDEAGNRLVDDDDPATPSPMRVDEFQIDGDAPKSALVTVPAAPDGNNAWFATAPLVAVSAVDQPGASGLALAEGEEPGAGTYLGIDGAPPQLITEPVRLGDGAHEVCFLAQDVAGNREETQCETVRVDTAAPAPAIVTDPAAPDGDNGVFVSEPGVTATADDGGGSGTALPEGADGTGLCTVERPEEGTPSPAGVCLSIDGAPFAPAAASVLSEGTHVVRAFAVDVAGHRSPLTSQVVVVDLSAPMSEARVIPPDPARGVLYRSVPHVALFASDGEGAGVAGIEYRIDDGPWQSYSVPFAVPPGTHTVSHRASDRSGPANEETAQTLSVVVDPAPVAVRPTGATPRTLSRLLGLLTGQTFNLRWEVLKPDTADAAGPVRVTVLVYNVLGQVVRQLDGGTVQVAPGQTVTGSTSWDGVGQSLLDLLPVGAYRYRVVAVDEVGNTAQSGQSTVLTVLL
ncbi:MAG: OmpL47-type beta-barrel domain-containing protein, partial [Acidimicrobiales bacterium]